MEIASRYLTFNKLGIITISEYLEKEYIEENDLKSALKVILNTISCYMGEVFGISESESWCLTIYIPKEGGGFLKCISGCRSRSIDDKSEFRDIPIGHGHIGMVYDRGIPLINVDMQAEQLQGMFQLPPAHRKSYDADRYRAFASFPVRFPGRDTVLGVVGITSDVPGRFTSANTVLIGMLEPHIGVLINKLKRPMLTVQSNQPASSGSSDGEQN
ncbi:GAF domain-containing protein [Azospirillum sp. B510]|uniref:GAF domain-containing protein n=1 Tax=Azospirillum sp. (strain B510) TaxID=137722 RepID=UPI0011D15F2A|nr:GAF domain-containing protein [Azospirillum sp. B510]